MLISAEIAYLKVRFVVVAPRTPGCERRGYERN